MSTNRRYQLIEALPYPRASRAGWLSDRSGRALHGVYERRITGGYVAALVNNGQVRHRYRYSASLADPQSGAASVGSFALLVHTLRPWLVPDDAERPTTNVPASECPRDGWRPLWHEPIILDSVIAGDKPVGILVGNTAETEAWTAAALDHGLYVARVASWPGWHGQTHVVTLIARPGRLATLEDLEKLGAEYRRQLPGYSTRAALARLRELTAADLDGQALMNPASADDLVVTGYCLGYPPATTAACITGTHG